MRSLYIALTVIICGGANLFWDSSIAVSDDACAFQTPSFNTEPPCTPYVVSSARVIATFPRTAFAYNYFPGGVTTLADGSVVVEETPNALFRIHAGQVSVMFAPWGTRYNRPKPTVYYWTKGQPPPRPSPTPTLFNSYFALLGSFDDTAVIQYGSDWIYAIRVDGSLDFRFPRAGSALGEQPTLLGRDPDGALWFVSWSQQLKRDVVYAFFLANSKLLALNEPLTNAFQGPSGFVYATSGKTLVELRSIPTVQARFYRGPILLKAGDCPGVTAIAVSRVGPDGSAWASTPVQVIHQHPNGRVSVIGLARYPSTITHIPWPLQVKVSPDGSAWLAGRDKLVRITTDDRVEVMGSPGTGRFEIAGFSPDGTVWLKQLDGPNAIAIVHAAPPSAF
jgi:hypothetical protein